MSKSVFDALYGVKKCLLDTLSVRSEVLKGLCVFSELGLAHRDIKLDNVVWNEAERVARLIDFDFVRLRGESRELETQLH